MKPSEIVDAVFKIDTEIKSIEERLGPLKDRLEILGFVRSDVRSLLDAGAPWAKIEERLEDLEAGIIPDAPEETAPFAGLVNEKPLGDAPKKRGRPKKATAPDAPPKSPEGPPLVAVGGPKAHVAPLASPLTPEFREKLERSLGAGPMTAENLARMSWAVGLDEAKIVDLLCEDPATFIRWTEPARGMGEHTRREVWGLADHFHRAVSMLSILGSATPMEKPSLDARAKITCETLGCSVSAALAAWKRLDPGAM